MTYNYFFYGKVHPERVILSLDLVNIELKNFSFEIQGFLSIFIKFSHIIVDFRSEKNYLLDEKCNIETLKNIIDGAVRTLVDTVCYIYSCGYDVEITRIYCRELNLDHIFGVKGELNISVDNDQFMIKLKNILNTSLGGKVKSNIFGYIFADFRMSIKYPSMAGAFCFRAIETIRSFFEDINIADADKRRIHGWSKFNESLKITKEELEGIRKFALPNRHGDYPAITYKEREEMMNKTREVIDKFIAYLNQ